MVLAILKPFRLLVKSFLETDTPSQLAAGLVLGMMLGLIPKGNLFAIILSVLLLGSKANLVSGALGTAVFAWLGMLTDGQAHRLGLYLLEHPSLQAHWARLYELPLAAWTHFNNTVVLGNLVFGLVLAGPIYWLGRLAFIRVRPWIVERLQRHKVDRVLENAENAANWRVA